MHVYVPCLGRGFLGPNGVACEIDRWNFELTLIADDPKSHLFRPFSWLMNSFLARTHLIDVVGSRSVSHGVERRQVLRAGQLGAFARRRLTSGDSQMTSADPKMGSDEVVRRNSPKKRLLYADIGGIKAISN